MGQGKSCDVPPEDMDALKLSTSFTSAEIRDLYGQFWREFPEDVITKKEFIEKYEELFPKGNATHFAKKVFQAYDHNNDGVIDFREFMMTLHTTTRGTVQEKLEWAFTLYDKNGDGFISQDEVINMMEAIYKLRGAWNPRKRAEDSCMEAFVALDKDQDQKLSKEEFIKGAKNSKLMLALTVVEKKKMEEEAEKKKEKE